jgi:hypothetical protein
MFCNLTPGQLAALMLIKAMAAKAESGTSKFATKFTLLVDKQEWDALAAISSMSADAAVTPSAADFSTIGTMSAGLQNACFFLALVDLGKDDSVKSKFQSALGTHCWDKIADNINANLTDKNAHFSAADLHQAYAPNDTAGCAGPSPFVEAIGALIGTGALVGSFFSKSVPDFFENDFANFFTGTLGGFFAGDFADFFKNIGEGIADGFVGFGNNFAGAMQDMGGAVGGALESAGGAIASAGESVGHALDPSNW